MTDLVSVFCFIWSEFQYLKETNTFFKKHFVSNSNIPIAQGKKIGEQLHILER